jgi:hypothetical protein
MREKAKPAYDKFSADGGAPLLKDIQAEISKVRK